MVHVIVTVCKHLLLPTSELVCQPIERFHSRGHRPYWFSETKDNVCIKIQFNSRRIGLVHQYGRRFFGLEHQYGRRDVI